MSAAEVFEEPDRWPKTHRVALAKGLGAYALVNGSYGVIPGNEHYAEHLAAIAFNLESKEGGES